MMEWWIICYCPSSHWSSVHFLFQSIFILLFRLYPLHHSGLKSTDSIFCPLYSTIETHPVRVFFIISVIEMFSSMIFFNLVLLSSFYLMRFLKICFKRICNLFVEALLWWLILNLRQIISSSDSSQCWHQLIDFFIQVVNFLVLGITGDFHLHPVNLDSYVGRLWVLFKFFKHHI